jgi:hypothetical protein
MTAANEMAMRTTVRHSWQIAVAIVLAVGALVVACRASFAEDITRVKADATSRVFVMAGFNPDCTFKSFPEIQVSAAPAKGQVSFKPGIPTRVQYSPSGNCVGTRVEGTGIYYTPTPGQTGEDTFTVTVLLDKAQPMTRTFSVIIDDKARRR